MKPPKEKAAGDRDPGRLSSGKRREAGSRRNRAAAGHSSENARRRAPRGGALAAVLSLGIALVAVLVFGVPGLWPSAVTRQDPTVQAPLPKANATFPQVGERAPDASFQSDGRSVAISSLRGEKRMLWLLATWCGSCAEGVLGLAKVQPELAHAGIKIIALRNYGNLGYPGPSIAKFIGRLDASLLSAPNWILGEASEQLARRYDPRGYPDIYFLIDGSGVIRAVDSAPSSTIDKILRFAGKGP